MFFHRLASSGGRRVFWMTVFSFLALPLLAAAQMPDDPATAKRHQSGMWRPEIDPDRRMSWKQTFTDKRFLIPHAIAFASGVLDVEVTHAGLAHHRCVEKGTTPFPSRGELYAKTMVPLAVFTAFDALMRKANLPFYLYNGGAAYGSVVHFRGAGLWLKNCW